jgi:hypothetical protein
MFGFRRASPCLSTISRMDATTLSPDSELTLEDSEVTLDALAPELSTAYVPPVPRTIAETGLSAYLIEHLIFNFLYSR